MITRIGKVKRSMGAFIIDYEHSAPIGQNSIENNKNKEDFTHEILKWSFSLEIKNDT